MMDNSLQPPRETKPVIKVESIYKLRLNLKISIEQSIYLRHSQYSIVKIAGIIPLRFVASEPKAYHQHLAIHGMVTVLTKSLELCLSRQN